MWGFVANVTDPYSRVRVIRKVVIAQRKVFWESAFPFYFIRETAPADSEGEGERKTMKKKDSKGLTEFGSLLVLACRSWISCGCKRPAEWQNRLTTWREKFLHIMSCYFSRTDITGTRWNCNLIIRTKQQMKLQFKNKNQTTNHKTVEGCSWNTIKTRDNKERWINTNILTTPRKSGE